MSYRDEPTTLEDLDDLALSDKDDAMNNLGHLGFVSFLGAMVIVLLAIGVGVQQGWI